MPTHDRHDRDHLLHLAQRAAIVMEAVAVGFEAGDSRSFNIGAAAGSIGKAHICDLDAALLIVAHMLTDAQCDIEEWRRDIPRFVATIALAAPE